MAEVSSLGDRARYDEFAAWYLAWVGESAGLIADPASGVLPQHLDGQRWLDMACGTGRTSRELARRGASVVGVDLSAELLSLARAVEDRAPLGVNYLVGDLARLSDWWAGQPFDGALCEMALMDIDDLRGAIEAAAAVLRPDGQFLVSFVNPCFPGNDAGLSSWPPDEGYAAEGFWTSPNHNPNGARIRVGSNHRMLSTYLNTLTDAGFSLERFFEPPTPVPYWLVVAGRRRA